ncbi:MAG: hypothetical protein NTY22_06995, partial [Proteobacteria bacterium]|nr:hypothetical protein [Pseudomonadota bacterium]
PKVLEMFNKYEFRRALYQIRETRERMKNDGQQGVQAPNENNTENPRSDESLRDDMNYLERLKTEPTVPAQPIEQPEMRARVLTPQTDDGSVQNQGQGQVQEQVQDQGQGQEQGQEQGLQRQQLQLLQLQQQQQQQQQQLIDQSQQEDNQRAPTRYPYPQVYR